MIHDLGEVEVREQLTGIKHARTQGAPTAVLQAARADVLHLVDGNGPLIADGTLGHLARFHHPGLQHGIDQKIRTGELSIQPVDGQNVASLAQTTQVITHVEGLVTHRCRVGVVGRSRSVPSQGGRGVGAGDAPPIEIGGKAIVILDLEIEEVDPLDVGGPQVEGDAHVGRGVAIVHGALKIDPDVRAVGCRLVVTHPTSSGRPARWIKRAIRASPIKAQAIVGGDDGIFERLLAHQHLLVATHGLGHEGIGTIEGVVDLTSSRGELKLARGNATWILRKVWNVFMEKKAFLSQMIEHKTTTSRNPAGGNVAIDALEGGQLIAQLFETLKDVGIGQGAIPKHVLMDAIGKTGAKVAIL